MMHHYVSNVPYGPYHMVYKFGSIWKFCLDKFMVILKYNLLDAPNSLVSGVELR